MVSVPVLKTGLFQNKEQLLSLLGTSRYISGRKTENLRQISEKLGLDADLQVAQTDASRDMEGLYIKIEEDGQVVERLKFVRPSFTQAVDASQSHWLDRPIVPNGLAIPAEVLYGPKLPNKE